MALDEPRVVGWIVLLSLVIKTSHYCCQVALVGVYEDTLRAGEGLSFQWDHFVYFLLLRLVCLIVH